MKQKTMKILIATDAFYPQVNGVVTTLTNVGEQLEQMGHEVVFLHPNYPGLKTFPLPSYPEIRLPWNVWVVGDIIRKIQPDAIHVATEGTLGLAARTFAYFHKLPITTSYHTKTPEYIKARFSWFPLALGYWFMRWLHKDSRVVLVTTESMKQELDAWSLHKNMLVWRRGVDLNLFHPDRRTLLYTSSFPTLLYVGRISVEKNLEAFLNLPMYAGRKVLVGDGPDRRRLQAKYPEALFRGYKTGEDLARAYADADVFVFPSKSDTFGLVMLEAAACGTPVAAYPVTGPKDVVINGKNGWLDNDLETAVNRALMINRNDVRKFTEQHYSWNQTAETFLNALVPITWRWEQLRAKK